MLPEKAVLLPALPKEAVPLKHPKTASLAVAKVAMSNDTLAASIGKLSNKYGIDAQMVKEIIFCESSNKPYAINKNTAIGEDVGYFQINSYYHKAQAKKLGWDIYDPQDNLEYGFWLLNKEGTDHWLSSRKCHGY